jgi:DNA polymerase-1
MSGRPTLFLIDGSSYIYRAFFALPFLSNSTGRPTNAAYGFTSMLLKVINDYHPDYLAIAFDTPAPTFRHEVYHEYKANRPEMPDNLIPQIPFIKAIVNGFNIRSLELEGFEADDIIATIARAEERKGMDVCIVSGDKDLMQLVTDRTTVIDTMRDKRFDPAGVAEHLGVQPERVVDFLGLVGDTSDNVPGVPGIGKKTAIKLIGQFGSIEDLLKNIDKVDSRKVRDNLIACSDKALLSRQLVTLDSSVPLSYRTEDLKAAPPDREALKGLFKELEFTTFLQAIMPAPAAAAHRCELVTTGEALLQVLARIKEAKQCALNCMPVDREPFGSEIAGISLAAEPGEAFYLLLAREGEGGEDRCSRERMLEQLKPALEDESIKKYGHNIKHEIIQLRRCGIELKGIASDSMVASYLLNPGKHSHSLEEIALEWLDHKMIAYKEIAGSGRKELTFDQIGTGELVNYACERCRLSLEAARLLLPKLTADGFDQLFYEMELPLIEVLATMEMNGVKIDAATLQHKGKEFEEFLNTATQTIYQAAGEEFNINSPQQLGRILFDKLQLPGAKKTKTGYSTDVAMLTGLSQIHPLPAEVLKYRSISKLKSTYVDALLGLISPDTGRIHTSYNQTVTATGRLSSSNPNLQNIPIRSEEGRKIRDAFIAEEGWLILSADYSQIELRILAHLSRDPRLVESFKRREDIHRRTAAEIFGLMPDLVTDGMRREAKVINFGIIYGMSSFGLAQELGISPKEASAFIENYFRTYQGVKAYIDSELKEAKEKGYVSTLMKRRRYLPEINSRNLAARQFAERTAINTPIQGTASDMVKMAMIAIHHRIKREELKVRMIIQVHDELVFEVPRDELTAVSAMVKEEMEKVVSLSVPLEVEVSWGKSWSEAH